LVVIENKLDDTGRDVVWQSLKYASYCSSLNTKGIKDIFTEYLHKQGGDTNAQQILEQFFDDEDFEEKLNIGNSQRIIMVAGEFRKEVTSTALWLLNYGLRIQCFKVTPHKLGNDYLLDFDQIIPLKEAEEYVIKVASKTREDIGKQEELENRASGRLSFWSQFLKDVNKRNHLFANISPSKESWIGLGLGKTGVGLNLVVSRNNARAEVYINRGSAEENKRVFDYLYKQKEQIEKEFGGPLVWERMDDKITSRIKDELDGVSAYEEKDFPEINAFLIDATERMKKAFSGPIDKLN
jgi:Domain of unknown function (DUF4268)